MTRFSLITSVAVVAGFAAAAPAPVIPHDRFYNHRVANARWSWGGWFTGRPSGQTYTYVYYPTAQISTQTPPASTSTSTDASPSLEATGSTSEAPAPSSSAVLPTSEPSAPVRVETSSEVPQTTSSALPATSTIVPTTTQAAPATTATPSSKASEGSSGNAEIDAYLKGHNDIRSQHGASPLTWATDLAAAAAKWAENCVWEHSQGKVGAFGENLAAGTNLGAAAAVKMWTDEASEYNPANPQYSHFTQVVWKATTEVGCAVRTCNNLLSGYSGAVNFHVCEYRAPGNVIGQFAENVQA